MQKIKMLVLDLDNTILRTDGSVSKATIEACRRLRCQGVQIVIATGRARGECEYVAELIGAQRYLVLMTGCQIYDRKEKKYIYHKALESKQAASFAERMEDFPNAYFQLYAGEKLYTSERSLLMLDSCGLPREYVEIARRVIEPIRDFPRALRENRVMGEKFFAIFESQQNADCMRELLDGMNGLYVVSPYPRAIEAMPQNVDKGTALAALYQMIGITKEEVMVIGDSENDIGMFDQGGICVAMGNGFPRLKERADYITKSIKEDGAALAIHKFFL